MIKRVKHRFLVLFLFLVCLHVFSLVFLCLSVFVFLQLRQFRKLKAHYGRFPDLMCDNYRPIQPLNGRNVYSVNNIVNTDD